MDFKEVEDTLVAELIYAYTINGSLDYVELIQNLDVEKSLSKDIIKEIYDNLKVRNKYFIQVILAYSYLCDLTFGNDVSFYKFDLDKQIEKFLNDEEFAIYLLNNAFKVLRNKDRFNLPSAIEDKELFQKLTFREVEVLSFNEQIKAIIKHLIDSLIKDGYSLEEAINISYIYWSKDCITPFLIEQYMPYERFIGTKDYQFKMMIVVVYQYLLSVNELDMRNYLESLKSLPEDDEEKKKIFGLFVEIIRKEREDAISDETLRRIPLSYRIFTL